MRLDPHSEKFALEAGLARANTTLNAATARLVETGRCDLAQLPLGALALLLAEAARAGAPPMLVVTPDQDSALSLARDLALFSPPPAGELSVLRFPAADASPFLPMAADRKAAMERVAALCHLGTGLPFRFLVAPVSELLRRVAPMDTLRAHSRTLRPLDEVDRDALIQLLASCGYLRVPVVEDPGSFAVRGGLLDIFPPHDAGPVRVELDDDLIASIKRFDPDTQRTRGELDKVFVHPARQTLWSDEILAQVRTRVSDLCDHHNLPSRKRAELVEELTRGPTMLGLDAYLPAFHGALSTLFDYLPQSARCVLVDPAKLGTVAQEERERAHADRSAGSRDAPVYKVDELYLSTFELTEQLSARPVACVHHLSVAGVPDDRESPFARFEASDPEKLLRLAGEEHHGLKARLTAARGQGADDTLAPLAESVREWLDGGLRVWVLARTPTQADRIAGLFRTYQLPVSTRLNALDESALSRPHSGQVELCLGELSRGFVLPIAGIVLLTDREIFGERPARSTVRRSTKKKRVEAFLDDLSALSAGDYVVHVEHGIGRYLGLERKVVPVSKNEELMGLAPTSVEVLVVEYAGGKLFLPVTRLNQIQKYAGAESKAPKIDKLGGQTFSKTKARVREGVKRLADDLLRLYAERAQAPRDPLPPTDRSYLQFEASFPFDETPDQTQAIEDVLADLEGPRAMDRVVCGDVGFGKTEVAMRAAFRVAMAGKQVALLCPTTVLAQQHVNTFRDRMEGYPLRIGQLSRFVPREEQAKTLAELKEGKLDVVVATHRLLSKDVHFKRLGLLVVDEEQRFGVAHKERIKQLRTQVDVLTLSATPIPRTLQLAITGLRDLSIISTPPVDRRAVRTFVTRWDPQVLGEAIARELSRGGQVFVVHNRIESLADRAARITELAPGARIAMAHGRMNEAALERVMADFIGGKADILCTTAIIESGLDIPRANTIIIDRADTYGLSQLYQLRGRVGRSRERAYCYLVAPPANAMSDEARERLLALERFTELGSGFKVASLDLELRGAGDVLGAEQSGSVTAVGFDLFLQMLEEAIRDLRGQTKTHDIDPELNLDIPLSLPDDYIDDIGVRLSFYKRFGGAESRAEVEELADEMQDRFGPAPEAARVFVRAMTLKPGLRDLRVLGCEATKSRVTLHLADDAPIDVGRLVAMVTASSGELKLTPDRKLTLRLSNGEGAGDTLDVVEALLAKLPRLLG